LILNNKLNKKLIKLVKTDSHQRGLIVFFEIKLSQKINLRDLKYYQNINNLVIQMCLPI